MPLLIPDDVLHQAGLTESQARIEIACRLFDAGKLELWPAAQFAGLSRIEMEQELKSRRIAIYRPTIHDLEMDLRAIDRLGI